MKNFKAYFRRDVSYTSHLASLALPFSLSLSLILALSSFAGVGVTKKQLDRTVSEINSNMSAAVSAEIDRNIDGHIERIGREAAMAATNFLPSFIEGLGEFAEASQFSLTDFTTNSLTFNENFMSNGVFVSVPHKAYFRASWVAPTNKGFTVASSSYPGIPAGTMFAIDEIPVAETNHPMRVVNGSGVPNGGQLVWSRHLIHNADMFRKPLELLWCEWRYAVGTVETNRIISESALYDAKIGRDEQSSTAYQTAYKMEVVRSDKSTSPNWVNPPPGEAHIVTLTEIQGVFRMAVVDTLDDSRILGTFTLVPTCLSDADNHVARHGTPKVSAWRRAVRFIAGLFAPDAVAYAGISDIFLSDAGLPSFKIEWTTALGVYLGEITIPINKKPPLRRVDSNGKEHWTSKRYIPQSWYSLDEWCDVESWIEFPIFYTICYEDALGLYTADNGTRYSKSTRKMNVATFKALFPGSAGQLKRIYTYPHEVGEVVNPCREGRHSYVHCVCSICGHQRAHRFENYNGCDRCVWDECVYTVKNNEIVEDPGSRSACGYIPPGEEHHGGWHGVGEILDEAGNRRWCGCYCGMYSDGNRQFFPPGYQGDRAGAGLSTLTLDHNFAEDQDGVSWEPGDELGNEPESYHHGALGCRRQGCGNFRTVVENHVFYHADGSFIRCQVEGIDNDNYHKVVGECIKCPQQVEAMDFHKRMLPNEGDGSKPCVCIGGVQFNTEGCGEVHHLFKRTACGEVRCLYCLAYHESSPQLDAKDHQPVQPVGDVGDEIILAGMFRPSREEQETGVMLRAFAPDENGHFCGCGLVQFPHNYVEDPDTGERVCPDMYKTGFEGLWWGALGCGWRQTTPEEDAGKFDLTVEIEESRGGYSLKGKQYKIGSFVWNPSKGEPAPTPSQLWPDSRNRPTSLPPIGSLKPEDLSPTVVDFTYCTELSFKWQEYWRWSGNVWTKKNQSFWDTLKRWLQNTPIIFSFQ